MTTVANQQFLTRLEECLVISYAYDERTRTFVLITDLITLRRAGHRDFARLTCSGVSDFVRKHGLYRPMQRFKSRYSLRESVTAVIVQLAKLTKTDDGYSLELALGCDFGRLVVSCSALTAEIKRSRATQDAPDQWRYFDAESGVEFDFLAPFDGATQQRMRREET
jgi:hypothetical protein